MRQIITDDAGVVIQIAECNLLQDGAIVIEDSSVWDDVIAHLGRRRWTGSMIEAFEPPAPSTDEMRATMPPISPRQLWLVAARIGITKDQVIAMVDAMEDQVAAADLRIEINEATTYHRNHASVVELSELLEIPAEQFDDLWLWAATF